MTSVDQKDPQLEEADNPHAHFKMEMDSLIRS